MMPYVPLTEEEKLVARLEEELKNGPTPEQKVQAEAAAAAATNTPGRRRRGGKAGSGEAGTDAASAMLSQKPDLSPKSPGILLFGGSLFGHTEEEQDRDWGEGDETHDETVLAVAPAQTSAAQQQPQQQLQLQQQQQQQQPRPPAQGAPRGGGGGGAGVQGGRRLVGGGGARASDPRAISGDYFDPEQLSYGPPQSPGAIRNTSPSSPSSSSSPLSPKQRRRQQQQPQISGPALLDNYCRTRCATLEDVVYIRNVVDRVGR